MFLARRNLFQNPMRFALSVAGVSLAVMLILLLNGIRSGVHRQVGLYLEHTPGVAVVSQKGVTNLLAATSLLPPGTTEVARAVPGVADVTPILSQFVILELHDRKQPAYLVGYDSAHGGGPWQLGEGREPRADDEAVFDRVLASRHDMHVGDRFDLAGRTFTLVGLSTGTTSFLANYLFVQKSAAEALLSAPGAASFLLVSPAPGASQERLLERLRGIPGTTSLPKQELIANDRDLIARVFNAPLLLMVGIAFLVGTMVVGLVIYTATVERQREYGVLKAIGAANRTLYMVVVMQALIATVTGGILGVFLAFGAGQLIMALRPQFLIVIEPLTVLRTAAAGLGIALLAALAPARVLARLAPADAFRRL